MEQLVRIVKTNDDGTATVMHIRESACSGDCHKCAGCGAAKETLLLEAKNAINAKVGDLVKIESETGPVLKAAVVLYMLPIVLFFAGYALGEALWQLGALIGCLSFALSIGIIVFYDRKVVKKQDVIYTITKYAR